MTVEESGVGWRMICGDCLTVMPTLGMVDAVVTDPPYGIDLGLAHAPSDNGGLGRKGNSRARQGHGIAHAPYATSDDSYETFVADVVPALMYAIDHCERAAVFSGPHIHEQRKPDAIGGVFCPAATARTPWGFKSLLPVLFYGKAPDLNRGSFPTVISSTETADRRANDHPVPKPIGWMLWLVKLSTRTTDTVLDPFCGSASTGVACLRLGRKFIGIEKDPTYFALACERLRAEEQGSTLQASRAGQLSLLGGGK